MITASGIHLSSGLPPADSIRDFDLDAHLRDLERNGARKRHLDPTAPLRVAIYARVSREEQAEGYSLDAQLRACRDFATSKGWLVVHELIEPGRSAYTEILSKRPMFCQCLSLIARGESDVMLVFSLDRWSRRILVALKTFKLMAQYQTAFVSVTEHLDYSSPEGQLFIYMLAIFAEYYSTAISKHTKKVKEERARRGLHNGTIPFGYRPGPDGIATPDEDDAPAVVDAFETYATGIYGDRDIAVFLNQNGHRTSGNWGSNPFSKDTISAMLRNPFYTGAVEYKGQAYPGQHQALISQELFDRVQGIRQLRRTR